MAELPRSYGVVFPDGKVAVSWGGAAPNLRTYDTWEHFVSVHGETNVVEWLGRDAGSPAGHNAEGVGRPAPQQSANHAPVNETAKRRREANLSGSLHSAATPLRSTRSNLAKERVAVRNLRSALYRWARILGDLQAMQKGPSAYAKRRARKWVYRNANRELRRATRGMGL